MSVGTRYLNMREAGQYIGRSYRWMQRHWCNLAKNGVKVARVPLYAPKGRLVFEKASLEDYMRACLVKKGDPDLN